jgi:transposase
MAFELLPDVFWSEIEPLLPKEPPKPKGGRPPIPNRQALIGIIFILRTGAAWNMLPKEMGCGSGVTCWRRFRDWTLLNVWSKVYERLLNILGSEGEINLKRAIIDSQSVRAVFGGAIQVRTRQTERKMAANDM